MLLGFLSKSQNCLYQTKWGTTFFFLLILNSGLACYTKEILRPGVSHIIASKTCENRRYMRRDHCVWYFDVESCNPTLSCTQFHTRGKVINIRTKKKGRGRNGNRKGRKQGLFERLEKQNGAELCQAQLSELSWKQRLMPKTELRLGLSLAT